MFETASVKVMRSYDYCHFEICLSGPASTITAVDELRKEAARLADDAVEQYKIAKENARLMESDESSRRWLVGECSRIEAKPESERTPEDKAKLKTLQDRIHWKRPKYDYDDEWEEPECGCADDDEPMF